MFLEQTYIFQEGLYVLRTDMNFSGEVIEGGGSICSSNNPLSHRTDTNFPRNLYLVLEHIQIFRRPYLVLEHIQFSRRPLCLEHIDIFQEGTPCPLVNRYFVNRYVAAFGYRTYPRIRICINKFSQKIRSTILIQISFINKRLFYSHFFYLSPRI